MAELTYGGLPVLFDNAYLPHGNNVYDATTADSEWFVTGWFDTGSPGSKKYTVYQPLLDSTWVDLKLFDDKSGRSVDYWSINNKADRNQWHRTFTSYGQHIICSIKKADAARSWCYCHTTGEFVFKGEAVDTELASLIGSRKRIVSSAQPRLDSAYGSIAGLHNCEASSLSSCTVSFSPIQTGSGTPSPSNIRPITGWSGATINVSQTLTGGTSYPISWQSQCGTIYGGHYNAVNGTLIAEWDGQTYTGSSDEDWRVESLSDGANFYIMTPSSWMRNTTNSSTMMCSAARSESNLKSGGARVTNSGNLNLYIGPQLGISTVAQFREWLSTNNLTVACRLKSPATYQLTGQTIRIPRGEVFVKADSGTSVSCTYWTHGAPEYGGIKVLVDNVRYTGNGAIDSYTSDPNFFLAAIIDTKSPDAKRYIGQRFGTGSVYGATRYFNDLSSSSVDYWSFFSGAEKGPESILDVTSAGRYIICSVFKEFAADFYIKNGDDNYLIKGSNVS